MKPLRITTHAGRYAITAHGPGHDGQPAQIGEGGFASHEAAWAAAPRLLAELAAGEHLGPLSAGSAGRSRVERRVDQ